MTNIQTGKPTEVQGLNIPEDLYSVFQDVKFMTYCPVAWRMKGELVDLKTDRTNALLYRNRVYQLENSYNKDQFMADPHSFL